MSSQFCNLEMRGLVGAPTTSPLDRPLAGQDHPYHHQDQIWSPGWTVAAQGYGPASMGGSNPPMPNQPPVLDVGGLPWPSASIASTSAVGAVRFVSSVPYNSLPSTAASMGNDFVTGAGPSGLLDANYSQPESQSAFQGYGLQYAPSAPETAGFVCGWRLGGSNCHDRFLCEKHLWRHIQRRHLDPSSANTTNATNVISSAGYHDSYSSGIPLSFGMRSERASGFVGVNYSQPGSQSTAQINPEVYFSNESGFGCKNTLWRHIKNKHVSPGVYRCNSCRKIFGRKDNLTSHTRGVHQREPSRWELIKLVTTPSLPS